MLLSIIGRAIINDWRSVCFLLPQRYFMYCLHHFLQHQHTPVPASQVTHKP